MNYYEILGVSKTASYEEIKSNYKTLVKKYHPDLYQGDKTFAEKKTQEINVAYDILSDSNKRAKYDLELNPPDDINTYNYTPPKYTTSNYNYDDNSYSNNYTSKTSSHYTSRNIQNNYTNSYNNNSQYTNDIFVNKLKVSIVTVFIVLLAYLAIFLVTIFQYNSYKKHNTINRINENLTEINTHIDSNNTSSSNEEFNINDYISDSDLRQIYYEYYTNTFDNFSEFKAALSEYIKTYTYYE